MKITVLGAGKSGVAAAKLAKQLGETVFVSDSSDASKIKPFLDELDSHQIEYESGTHSERIYDCDLMILSPGIKKELYVVQQFYRKEIPVISEIEYAYRSCTQPIIAITGSNGKTTTTTLLGRMLEREYGGHRTAGNIGKPLTEEIDVGDKDPIAVELSSFQLETIDTFKPKTAMILNISENHLDWYRTMNDYINAKLNIIKNSDENTELIINADDERLNQQFSKFPGKLYTFSLRKLYANAHINREKIYLAVHGREVEIIELKDLVMKGPHHLMNMMAAALAAYLNGVTRDQIRTVLRHFDGIEHRMEIVQSSNGRIYINDSKATSV
ncbi:MAG: UDP-N-acetylmuramoyl-L-alanine--D-glutamate ligase, partial [Calditrichaeota bacterium]|nr:UDP-N-acetylmuramoyl-L-alanine--D-glutamate ligase [Calditrichota bacterium]